MTNVTYQGGPTTLGDRLRHSRKAKHWTQEQLAAKAGTTQAVIQKIENGKSLRPRKIQSLSDALNVTPSWLMFGQEDAPKLDKEAIEIAKAWSSIDEPTRSLLKREIREKASSLAIA